MMKLNKGWLISKLNKEISDHELRLKEYRLNDVIQMTHNHVSARNVLEMHDFVLSIVHYYVQSR